MATRDKAIKVAGDQWNMLLTQVGDLNENNYFTWLHEMNAAAMHHDWPDWLLDLDANAPGQELSLKTRLRTATQSS